MAGESIKRSVRSGDLEGLSLDRFHELRVDLNASYGKDEYTPLHWACHYGKAEVVQHLLDIGASITVQSRHGWTAAHICAIRGCAICLQILWGSGIDLSLKDKRGYNCAHLAAIHGKTSVLQVLIKVGVDLKETDKRGWNVVHHTAFHGRIGILQLLVKLSELDPNLEDSEGNTPAHLSASEGQLDCLRLLVYHKHQPMDVVLSRNNDGSTPKDLAVQFHKQECVDFLDLAESEADVFDYKDVGKFPAHTAAREGNVQLLSMLIKEGHCGINDKDQQGATPAHKAAGNGQVECLQWLVDHGADVTLENAKGERPREVAIRFANVGCIAILSPKSPAADWEGEEAELDYPPPISLERARERMEKAYSTLEVAKTRFRELGGELPEDREIELLKVDHQRSVDELETKLLFERERREVLEAEMDQMRKKLQDTTMQHSISHKDGHTSSSTPDHIRLSPQKVKRILPRKSNHGGGGGAFIKIGRV